MAGSFGFEADKYEVSIQCGERALLPAVRKSGLSTVVMADGFSCKEQIEQDTNRHALHLAEVMALALREGPHGPNGVHPEKSLIEPRLQAQRRSTRRAGALTIAGGVAVIAGLWLGSRLIRR